MCRLKEIKFLYRFNNIHLSHVFLNIYSPFNLGTQAHLNQDEDEKCQQICTYYDDDIPMCGDDGVVYPNECAFYLALCDHPDLRVLDDRRCENLISIKEHLG